MESDMGIIDMIRSVISLRLAMLAFAIAPDCEKRFMATSIHDHAVRLLYAVDNPRHEA
jgi:hypothetical protein